MDVVTKLFQIKFLHVFSGCLKEKKKTDTDEAILPEENYLKLSTDSRINATVLAEQLYWQCCSIYGLKTTLNTFLHLDQTTPD